MRVSTKYLVTIWSQVIKVALEYSHITYNISQKYMIYCHRINRCIILGSVKDWSNYWKKGVQCRQNVREDIPYAGFFTQLGHIHRIYHIWLVFTSFDKP